MGAEKVSYLVVRVLVIKVFVIALILRVCFVSQLCCHSAGILPLLYYRQLLTLALVLSLGTNTLFAILPSES